MGRDPVAQDLFAHITCLDTRFAPTLESEMVFDAGVFEPEQRPLSTLRRPSGSDP